MPALIPSRPNSVALNCGIASSLSFSLSGFSSVDLAVPNAREAVAMEVKERAKFHEHLFCSKIVSSCSEVSSKISPRSIAGEVRLCICARKRVGSLHLDI